MTGTMKLTTVILLGSLTVFGCASKTGTGAAIGTASGAAIGAIIGKQAGNTAAGALIGAAVGGATGAAIGHYMDRQAAEIERDLEGAKVERIGEGIKITFDSGILFAVNSDNLQPAAKANLDDLATILNKYDDTNVLIEGHTDASGSETYNQELSERRAGAVAYYLATQSVDASRFSIMGYGEAQPVASNSTASGKQANRRVELAIMANEKLKNSVEVAEQG